MKMEHFGSPSTCLRCSLSPVCRAVIDLQVPGCADGGRFPSFGIPAPHAVQLWGSITLSTGKNMVILFPLWSFWMYQVRWGIALGDSTMYSPAKWERSPCPGGQTAQIFYKSRASRARISEPNFPPRSRAGFCSDADGRAAPTWCRSI